MDYYIDAWKNYVNFEGRARRKAFWMFMLFNFIAFAVTSAIDGVLGFTKNGFTPITGLYGLAVFLPYLGYAVRRLHDTGRSGWWYLIFLVPCVGWIILLVFLVTDSQPGSNEYGPNPKGA